MDEKNRARVLIVDDVHINRMILSSMLASNGITADLAGSGKQCLAMVKEKEYDLILLDHRMPETDGVDTLMDLKDYFIKSGREIPVVCHTTGDAVRNINLYIAAGFTDVLIKPIQPRALMEILMTYLPDEVGIQKREDREESGQLAEEMEMLPAWVGDVEGLDARVGVKNCGTALDFMDALKVYVFSIHERALELERFVANEKLKMFTFRIHSLKSMSHLIGIERVSELAGDLLEAGQRENISLIEKKLPSFLEEYHKFEVVKESFING